VTRVEIQITETNADDIGTSIDVTRDDTGEAVGVAVSMMLAVLGDRVQIVLPNLAQTFFSRVTTSPTCEQDSENVFRRCDKIAAHDAHYWVLRRPGLSDSMRHCSGWGGHAPDVDPPIGG
jgi:hypothetical protein